ncbi:MAG: hypothetical protein ACTSUO_04625 [Candidatus Thorarchaeota archaeon]
MKSPERKKRIDEITGKTEELRSFERLDNAISAIDDECQTITEQYPYLLKTEELDDFLSECSTFLKKVESGMRSNGTKGTNEHGDCDPEDLGD